MKRAGPTLLVAAAIVVASAVNTYGAGPGMLSGHVVTSWTTNDGVPIGPVLAFAQDSDGYLWLGTTGGVVRFDGARFTNWDAISDTPLPRVSVFALTIAADGTLWIGFDGVGVRGVRDGAVLAPEGGTPPRGRITSLLEDSDGTLWAASGGRLYRLREAQWEAISREMLPADDVYSVEELPPGELWIGAGTGAFRLCRSCGAFERAAPGPARGVTKAADGTLWASDPVRVVRRLDDGGTPQGAAGRGLRLLRDSRGNIWVATIGQGLWRIRSDGADAAPLVEHATAQTGLSGDVVQGLYEDREGNIWVGTMGGLHSLTPQLLKPLVTDGLVRAVEPDADGTVWVGTSQGLLRFTQWQGGWRGERVGPDGIDVRSLHREASGALWIGTDRDLWRRHVGPVVPVSGVPAMQGVRSITSDGSSTWVGDGRQLFHFERGVLSPAVPHGNRDGVVLAYADSRGSLWTAFRDGTIVVRKRNGGEVTFSAPEDAGLEGVRATDTIFEDSRHVVWVGGTAGLRRFSDGAIATLNRHNGLPAARIMAMTEDHAGYLWLLADRGPDYVGRRGAVIRLHPGAFTSAVSGGAALDYTLYDATHGVALLTIQNTSAARSKDGAIWFVAGGSLTVVDPRRLPDDAAPRPPARIEGAIVDGARVAASSDAPLPAGTRNVQIDYTSLRLTSPGQLRFRYRLEGFDRDWVYAGARRQAYYTRLGAGDYAFHVAASDDGAMWGPPVAWRFSVRPAFHETAWFFGLSATCLGLAGWATWRGRVWVVEQRFSAVLTERARLAREIHDTMLQSMVGLGLQCQAIARRCGEASEQREQLLDLRRQVEEHIRVAREAILDIRSPMLETHGLAGALEMVGRRAVSGAATEFEIVSEVRTDRLPTRVQSELFRIGHEAIANAAKHASARTVRVELRAERRATVLRVSDDGQGFDYDGVLGELNGHYGLVSMRERAARLGGRLSVSSSPARGTTVEAVIPARPRHEGSR